MFKRLTLFCMSGISYLVIELLWRGRSHWSMFVLGGMCFLAVGSVSEAVRDKLPLLLQAALGAVIITLSEFVTGCIVNLELHMNVWSYYGMPYNIMGQVCLPYMILWFFMSIVCIFVYDRLGYCLFGEEKHKYKWL